MRREVNSLPELNLVVIYFTRMPLEENENFYVREREVNVNKLYEKNSFNPP